MERINFILSLLLTSIGLVVGSCFLLLSVPKVRELHNYLMARKVMGVAYLLLGVSMVSELVLPSDIKPDIDAVRTIILTISSILAFSFTYSSLMLINIRFAVKQKLAVEIIPVCVISCANWVAYIVAPVWAFYLFQVVFILYYVFVLFKYTILFRTTFREYKQQMDNFFSEQEWKRLQWVNFSFYYALLVGILALVSILSPEVIFIVFKVFIIPFYVYYGFQLVNYGLKYPFIETICMASARNDKEDTDNGARPASFGDLEALIDGWIEGKNYLQTGITVEQAADQLHTNRTYLSGYINTYKQQTFREWINRLRMDEAKLLIADNTSLTISEVGRMVGFTDKSNFTRQFIKHTSMSPSVWKSENVKR